MKTNIFRTQFIFFASNAELFNDLQSIENTRLVGLVAFLNIYKSNFTEQTQLATQTLSSILREVSKVRCIRLFEVHYLG